MFDQFREPLLRWLRVPPEPHAPAGSPDSVRVFRAGINFYKLALLRWVLTQIGPAVAVLFVIGLNAALLRNVQAWWVRSGWIAIETVVVTVFLGQLLFTYALLRLNYELRWYIVTDRSLRIRSGIWFVEEMTMTFANIQQVNLTQGPLQRFLGLADVEVTSAGGGEAARRTHTGRFEGVDNAEAIRDFILERLRRYRDAGLGDPDESHAPSNAIEAAQEALAEARQLRRAITGGSAAS